MPRNAPLQRGLFNRMGDINIGNGLGGQMIPYNNSRQLAMNPQVAPVMAAPQRQFAPTIPQIPYAPPTYNIPVPVPFPFPTFYQGGYDYDEDDYDNCHCCSTVVSHQCQNSGRRRRSRWRDYPYMSGYVDYPDPYDPYNGWNSWNSWIPWNSWNPWNPWGNI